MAQGLKTGGRQKGTPNKNRAALRERLEEFFPGYDPLVSLAGIAVDEANDLSIRIDCHKTIAGYVHPKVRSVDIMEQPESNIVIQIVEPHQESL